MLFNSYVFLFAFLPVSVAGFFACALVRLRLATIWLVVCSIVFYGWWDWRLTTVLLASIVTNYIFGRDIVTKIASGRRVSAHTSLWIIVAANLLALGYYKYANFFVSTVYGLADAALTWDQVALPIGISFFTFTQIAFQVDAYQGKVTDTDPVRYVLFVTYFPHLIAGPILHHAEMMPQFRGPQTYRLSLEAVSVGVTVFILGLFKKLLIADSIGGYADSVFTAATLHDLTTPTAWRGVLAYTLQIYFDFSAYCDMAIGVSRMFNIRLPANFESPYKSRSIKEFWRRWHMTLSRFLRDYLYIPLGGNRFGPARRYTNLCVTMVLGGLWHGAGWTYIIWGALHGTYLCVNHGWDAMAARFSPMPQRLRGLSSVLAWSVTFIAVMTAWVFFRAPDIATALTVLAAMMGVQGDAGPTFAQIAAQGIEPLLFWLGGDSEQVAWLIAGLAAVLFLPNIRQLMDQHGLVLPGSAPATATSRHILAWLRWTPSLGWALATIALFLVSLAYVGRVSPFLYFQF